MWFTILCLITFIFSTLSCENIAVLVLARGGSKGIPLKNLHNVGSESLLARAILTSKRANLNVTVSTDHPAIALAALKSGASVFRRSKITATDWAPSIWGAAEFLASRPEIDILVLLQATSPFIKAKHLKEAVNKINSFDCVFSTTRSFKLRWKNDNGVISPINFKLGARPRRQDWSGELLETGAFYVSRRKLIESGYFQNNNCSIIEVSTAESIEVDTSYDIRVANALLRANLV